MGYGIYMGSGRTLRVQMRYGNKQKIVHKTKYKSDDCT